MTLSKFQPFMKGCDVESPKKRKSPHPRTDTFQPKPKRSRNIIRHCDDEDALAGIPIETPPPSAEHDYDLSTPPTSCRCLPQKTCIPCNEKTSLNLQLIQVIQNQQAEIERWSKIFEKPFSIHEMKDNDVRVHFYTGLQYYAVFEWLYNRLSPKVAGLTYTSYKKQQRERKMVQNAF